MKLVACGACLLAGLHLSVPAVAAGVVSAVAGQASVQRTATAAPVPLPVGAQLNDGDIVRLLPGSFAEVVCGDEQRVTIRDAVQVFACKAAGNLVFSWNGKDLPSPRAETRVLMPAGTQVLDTRPSIRWTKLNATRQVRVVVRGGDIRWERLVHDTGKLAYPADAPPLARGRAYRVLVLDPDADQDIASGSLNSGFRVLSDVEAQATSQLFKDLDAREGLRPLDRLHLGARARLLAGLNADTIELLEPAATSATATAATLSLLGTAWRRTGCLSCALPILERAYTAATTNGDEYTAEESGTLLVEIYRKQNRTADANVIERRIAGGR
ncbi:hypothetical protein [Niveibacterium microcysteis]|uniref:FecR protein domain-containing protein n=1 Tax=Niveibacterium microcysteis TaxID=2811415 RepID=A0ABX7M0R0_9RHOO|nr:hypothetical protein [Niveibacterium microcysteis]QSI75353.1 hypothetical protein JY500_12605 [Niveibacterium microcysteis]